MASLFGGLAEGIETGTKLGLMARESEQKAQALDIEKKKQAMEAFKTRKTYMDAITGLKKDLITLPPDRWSEHISSGVDLLAQTVDDPDLKAFGESIKVQGPEEARKTVDALDRIMKASAKGEQPTISDILLVKGNVNDKANEFLDKQFGYNKEKYEAQDFNTAFELLQKTALHGGEITNEEATKLAEIKKSSPEQYQKAHLELIKLEKGQDKTLLNQDDYVIAARSLGITDLNNLTKEQADSIIEKTAQIKEDVAKRTQAGRTAEQVVMVQNADGSYSLVSKGTRVGKEVVSEKGEKIYKSPPSEIRVMNSALTDNLASAKKVREAFNAGNVGPVAGRAKKFGTMFYNDKEFTTLKNRVGQLRTIIYGLSGKQINEAEYKWLTNEIIPNLQNPDENFLTTLDEFEGWVKRKQGSIHSEYPALGQNKPHKAEAEQATSSGNRFTIEETP